MRHLVLVMLMLTACGAVVLAAQEPPKGSDAARKDEPKPVNKFCPIERENEIDPRVTATQDGKLVAFCCADCIDKFKADPKKYMKDLK